MNRNQEIYYGLASQVLFFDAETRPSAATDPTVHENTVGDSSTVSAVTGAVSIDAVDTTVDETSGLGDDNDVRKVWLTAVTSVLVGRRYLLTNTLGYRELVEVVAIGTNYVIVRHPLQVQYLATSTFEGVRLSMTVDTSWAGATANVKAKLSPRPRYRVRWPYTAGGVSLIGSTYFDLTRYSTPAGVTALDVDSYFPGFIGNLPTHYRQDQGRGLIAAARHAVRFDLRAGLKSSDMSRDAEAIDLLTVYKANELAQEDKLYRAGGSLEAVEAARDGYGLLLRTVLLTVGFSAEDGTGAVTTTVDRSILQAEEGGE